MTTQRVGLTLGKFAPFHKGHQYLIETALAEVDQLIVLIYNCPETTKIPLDVRAGWIRKLYPQVEVIEAWDGPAGMGNTSKIKRMQEKYVKRILGDRKITHFYSSEFYGEHMSMSLAAVDRRIDEKRKQISISATQIRKNPYRYRNYVDPFVYKDLVMNIVFLGAPSTGKTTLVQKLAKNFKTVWMPEYGREYWDKHQKDRRLTLEQLVEIAEGHLEREEKLLCEANRFLFSDTNALTTYLFSQYYHGSAHERLTDLADQCVGRYDVVFVCDVDIPYDDTWDRSGDANRTIFQEEIIKDLTKRKIPYFVLRGKLEQRMVEVKKVLKSFNKF